MSNSESLSSFGRTGSDGLSIEEPPAGAVYEDLTDDELVELALAADLDSPIHPDAIPFNVFLSQFPAALPSWYMPPVTARVGRKWRTPVILVVVVAFLVIDAFGLCNTYGQLGFA